MPLHGWSFELPQVEIRKKKKSPANPSITPDLTALNFSFWSQAMAKVVRYQPSTTQSSSWLQLQISGYEVVRCQPSTLLELMAVIENFTRTSTLATGRWHATRGTEPNFVTPRGWALWPPLPPSPQGVGTLNTWRRSLTAGRVKHQIHNTLTRALMHCLFKFVEQQKGYHRVFITFSLCWPPCSRAI